MGLLFTVHASRETGELQCLNAIAILVCRHFIRCAGCSLIFPNMDSFPQFSKLILNLSNISESNSESLVKYFQN